MDDRFRDVMQRPVMRGMYMPMYGNTDTWGGLTRLQSRFGLHQLGLTLDAHRVQQFGDMWMFSLFPGIPDMYLLNLGDVTALNTAATLDYSRTLGIRWNLRSNVRLDWSRRDVLKEDAASVFRGRWDLDELRKQYTLLGGSGTLTYRLGSTAHVRLALASVSRLPSNVENFGNYVYNYVDGYFYTGNPNLKPERSHQVEVGLEMIGLHLGIRASLFFNELRNYIYGLSDNDIDSGISGRSSTYRFRVYTNAESAFLTGGEVSGIWSLRPNLNLTSTLSYTYGHNRDLDEPLSMIPPLRGVLTMRYSRDKAWIELESRWANAQNRAAEQSADEDRTDGYNILNVRTGYRVHDMIELKLGIENIFDTFYHEHLSINNLPSRGRNLYLNLHFTL
jgi:iron complex outermembrane receptor protein